MVDERWLTIIITFSLVVDHPKKPHLLRRVLLLLHHLQQLRKVPNQKNPLYINSIQIMYKV
jgi:hypothetical protein